MADVQPAIGCDGEVPGFTFERRSEITAIAVEIAIVRKRDLRFVLIEVSQ